MNPNRFFVVVLMLAMCLTVTSHQAQAQQSPSGSTKAAAPADKAGTPDLSTLLARAAKTRQRAYSLMPEIGDVNPSVPAFSVTPMTSGNLPVTGGGTLGRLTKWTGLTSSNSAIGDSIIYEDKFSKVGIGTDSPTSRLTVAGTIESSSGGVKFPDGTVQTTAGIAANQTVLVRDLDNPARQPVQANATCTSGSVGCSADLLSVPAGKRLVIEFVSMIGDFSITNANALLIVTTNVGSQQVDFACNSGSALGLGNPKVVVSQSVRLYADPGTIVSFSGRSNSGVSHSYKFSLSGYLVDTP